MHHDGSIDEETGKAEINVFYNKTQGGVDSLDQMVHAYMSKRQVVRWPLTFFCNLLDVAAVAAYICFTAQNPKWNVGKKHRRKVFLEMLDEEICLPLIQRRNIPKSVRISMLLCGVLPLTQTQEARAVATESGQRKRKRCSLCQRNKDRKSKLTCSDCGISVCGKHSASKRVCLQCQ